MRDSSVIEGFDRMEKMVGHDIRILNKTVATLAMRQDAIQKVMFGGRGSFIWACVLSLFAPKALERAVGRMHQFLQAKYEEDMRKALEEARKPKLAKPSEESIAKANIGKLAMVVLAIAIMGSGCVPKSHLKNSYNEGYQRANVECLQLQGQYKDYISKLQVEIAVKNERLRSLNQVNEDGSLRYGEKTAPKPSPTPKPEEKK